MCASSKGTLPLLVIIVYKVQSAETSALMHNGDEA